MNIINMNVFIHSNAETGEPDSVDVFEIDGKVHMQWFHDVFVENNDRELAEEFYRHLKKLDDCAWFKVEAMIEDATGIIEHYAKVVGIIESVLFSPVITKEFTLKLITDAGGRSTVRDITEKYIELNISQGGYKNSTKIVRNHIYELIEEHQIYQTNPDVKRCARYSLIPF